PGALKGALELANPIGPGGSEEPARAEGVSLDRHAGEHHSPPALPESSAAGVRAVRFFAVRFFEVRFFEVDFFRVALVRFFGAGRSSSSVSVPEPSGAVVRSEERRVGREARLRGAAAADRTE